MRRPPQPRPPSVLDRSSFYCSLQKQNLFGASSSGEKRRKKNSRTPTSVFISVIRYASRSELRGRTGRYHGDHELLRYIPKSNTSPTHCPGVVKKTQIVFPPAPSRQTQSAAWTSTVAIIPTQYHESPPNARPHYACGRPLSHEQCKEGKIQQNSETRVFLRVHPFLSESIGVP